MKPSGWGVQELNNTPARGPGAPQPRCYRCRRAANAACRFCGRPFCEEHGGPGKMLCRGDWRRAKIAGQALVLFLAAVALAAAVWHFARWLS